MKPLPSERSVSLEIQVILFITESVKISMGLGAMMIHCRMLSAYRRDLLFTFVSFIIVLSDKWTSYVVNINTPTLAVLL